MTIVNMNEMTKEELYDRAQELDIRGRSSMTKNELIAAIRTTMDAALEKMTKEELYNRAQELDIRGRSSMMKNELIAAIRLEHYANGDQGDGSGSAQMTFDHDLIRQWTEARGGVPTVIRGTEDDGEGIGLLRLHFPDAPQHDSDSSEQFEEITWTEFFDEFERSKLAMLYQKETEGGEISRFNKIVSRN